MFETKKRGLGVYKKDNGSDEAYKYYKEEVKKLCATEEEEEAILVDKQIYRKVCDEFNKLFIDEVLISSEEMRLPYRLGTIRVKKSKMKYDDKNKLKIDWAAS